MRRALWLEPQRLAPLAMGLPLDFPFLLCPTPHPKLSRDSPTPLHQDIYGGPNLPLATGLPLWAYLWVTVVLSLVFKVSMLRWPCSAHQAALALLCLAYGHPLSLRFI